MYFFNSVEQFHHYLCHRLYHQHPTSKLILLVEVMMMLRSGEIDKQSALANLTQIQATNPELSKCPTWDTVMTGG